MKIRVLGVGMGPQHVTPEVAEALGEADYVIAARKRADDGLLAARRAIAAVFRVEVVEIDDPERDRGATVAYPDAVAAWHAARVTVYEQVLRERGGTAAFLVWGDPSLYDSTIRVVEQLAARLGAPWDVVAAGQRNIVVMLGGALDLDGLDDWFIWWGANLGTPAEELAAGRVVDVREELTAARPRQGHRRLGDGRLPAAPGAGMRAHR